MLTRTDNLSGRTETFTYDELNRLKSSTVSGSAAVGMTYDSFGNIVNKGGVAYTYGGGSGSCSARRRPSTCRPRRSIS